MMNNAFKKNLRLMLSNPSGNPTKQLSPILSGEAKRSVQYSPMSDLAMNFGDLAAQDYSETPKRKLTISDDSTPASSIARPLKPLILTKQLSVDDGICVDTPSPSPVEAKGPPSFDQKSFDMKASPQTNESALEMKSSAFRRFKNLPLPFCGLESSPPRSGKLNFGSPPSSPSFGSLLPQELTPEKPKTLSLFGKSTPEKLHHSPCHASSPDHKTSLCHDDESSQDSGFGFDKSPFAKPSAPAPRRRVLGDETNSPQRLSSSPIDFRLHFSSQNLKHDSPIKLRKSSLTFSPASDDGDDGFLELVEEDDMSNSSVSEGLQGLLSNPLLSSAPIPKPDECDFTPQLLRVSQLKENRRPRGAVSRRGLFRSPSCSSFLSTRSSPVVAEDSRPIRKRSEPCRDECETPTVLKRRCSVDVQRTPDKLTPRTLQRSQSEAMIKSALDRDADEEDVIGDFSKPYCLPSITGKHRDLKCISPATMASLMNGEYDHCVEKYTVIDCRYTYEFDGGHIKDALNIWERDTMYNKFVTSNAFRQAPQDPHKRNILIFHCEFSSERGPKMSRFLRKMDRTLNKEVYPSLYYPEIYLLEGGYKAFYYQHKEQCQPQTYLPMAHEDYLSDLKHFRLKSKSWAGETSQKTARPSLRKLKW